MIAARPGLKVFHRALQLVQTRVGKNNETLDVSCCCFYCRGIASGTRCCFHYCSCLGLCAIDEEDHCWLGLLYTHHTHLSVVVFEACCCLTW